MRISHMAAEQSLPLILRPICTNYIESPDHSNKVVFSNFLFNLQIAVLIFNITSKPFFQRTSPTSSNQKSKRGFQGGNTVKNIKYNQMKCYPL